MTSPPLFGTTCDSRFQFWFQLWFHLWLQLRFELRFQHRFNFGSNFGPDPGSTFCHRIKISDFETGLNFGWGSRISVGTKTGWHSRSRSGFKFETHSVRNWHLCVLEVRLRVRKAMDRPEVSTLKLWMNQPTSLGWKLHQAQSAWNQKLVDLLVGLNSVWLVDRGDEPQPNEFR
jgi:hypothetical protein